MKKLFLLSAALISLIVSSCRKDYYIEEVILPGEDMKIVTLQASVAGASTKTSYSSDASGTFSWTAGDQISVKCSDGNFYTFTAQSSAASSSFTGKIPKDESVGDKAYFPADAGHTSGNFSLPSYKDISAHDSADIPMLGSKGAGGAFSFVHCAGAALITITNIPDGITAATITVESAHASDPSHCIKLSGSFWINNSGTTEPYWSGAYAATSSEKQYSRKVNVSGNTAKLYLPCPGGYSNNCPNKITVVGHSSSGNVTLYTEKAMAKLGKVDRAHVLPLTPLVYNQLGHITWSSVDMYPLDNERDAFAGDGANIIEWKAFSDKLFIYLYFKVTESVVQAKGQFDARIMTAFDTDNNTTTGNDASYNLGTGFEALSKAKPFSNAAKSPVTFSSSPSGDIQCPIGTSLGTVETIGHSDGLGYVYAEICIPRAKIGSPASSTTIRLRNSLEWASTCDEQSITLP